jgi:four helix bundle protein
MLPLGHKQSDVYRQAVLLAKEIYRITEGFPDSERAVLVFTLRRLTVLLCQNIALADSKRGKKQKRLFEACLEHCVAIDAQLEVAIAVLLLPEEIATEATRLLHTIYKSITLFLQTAG